MPAMLREPPKLYRSNESQWSQAKEVAPRRLLCCVFLNGVFLAPLGSDKSSSSDVIKHIAQVNPSPSQAEDAPSTSPVFDTMA
eukprot:1735508-Heterocapsa_arctica.AAC.1